MSKELLDLKDYKITDKGELLVKYEALFDQIRNGEPIEGITAIENDDVKRYNQRNRDRPIQTLNISGHPEMPPVHAYDFNLPQPYLDLDIDEYLADRLIAHFPELPEPYTERLVRELAMMRQREMEDFLRTLIYMVQVFEDSDVVYGIGRGSGCASLVLFLIGIHMVDPIKYDIPIEEFLR